MPNLDYFSAIAGMIIASIAAIGIGYKMAVWRNGYVKREDCKANRTVLAERLEDVQTKVGAIAEATQYMRGKIDVYLLNAKKGSL